jgi:hypothetical protein
MAPPSKRAIFGANKYAALHLMVARWLQLHAAGPPHHYVTLGGSELKDIRNLSFVGKELVDGATTYEQDSTRFRFAEKTSASLLDRIAIVCVHGDIFEFRRATDQPHLVFIDLEGTCRAADYVEKFSRFFRDGVLKPADGLLITSYLGRNPGWSRVLGAYDAEFRILGITGTDAQKWWYRRAHPAFALFRALERAGMLTTVRVDCVGCVLYADNSPMGLYGYALTAGKTKLRGISGDGPYLHMRDGFVPELTLPPLAPRVHRPP